MKLRWAIGILLVLEVVFLACAMGKVSAVSANAAVLLLVANSVLLIWCVTRWRRKPACCR